MKTKLEQIVDRIDELALLYNVSFYEMVDRLTEIGIFDIRNENNSTAL
jgi:predicted transcriptional regulator YheO